MKNNMRNIFIKKLIIENYKCFNNESINFNVPDGENEGSGLNILIGENGNGKTAILEAINYLTQNTYSSENKLQISDFHDYEKEILIKGETEVFECKSTIDFYKDWFFKSSGFEFHAKSRETKARGKLLSSSFEIHNYFNILEKYTKKDGSEGKDVDSRDKIFSNSSIIDNEINIFYFDKNRTRQITTGNYKTIFEKICDDLNWKFTKNMTDANRTEIIKNICGEYFKNVVEVAKKGVGIKVADDLKKFFGKDEYKDLKIDLLDLLHPFSNSFFAVRKENELQQINARDLGSGVEIILTLLLLKNIAGESKGNILYLIDEPELHLHPKAQEKLIELLIQESRDKQIIVSTHSPYLFKNCLSHKTRLLIFNRGENNKIEILNAKEKDWKIFPWSPSWGEINYKAYDLITEEFHNELYGYAQELSAVSKIEDFDKKLLEFDGNIPVKSDYTHTNGNKFSCTLCTYIRHQIHHPDNRQNKKYEDNELKQSIDILIKIIRKSNKND